ncbi:MAG: TlpA family protein disulfide reductase [Gammaproteobacteria bacterium]|nr:TlpA family protein disulfide reductase [Gammaproteobacteria bacterium]
MYTQSRNPTWSLPFTLVLAVTACAAPERPIENRPPPAVSTPAPAVRGLAPPPSPQVASAAPSELRVPRRGRGLLLGHDLLGKPVYTGRFRGQVLVLNYWASWCPVCWTEVPHMQALHERYVAQGVTVISINYKDLRAAMRVFLVAQGDLSMPLLRDEDGLLESRYGAFAIPTTLVFNRAGELSFQATGVFEADPKKIETAVQRLL